EPSLLAARNWPAWCDALKTAHNPAGIADLAATSPARARLAYDELLSHQVTLAIARARARRKKGRATVGTGALASKVMAALPYQPTGAQTRVTAEILADMAGPTRMSRLLQGDVGAGKTLVALLAMLAAVEAGGQAAIMAPTEILARQHLASLRELAEHAGLNITLLTGRDKGAERAEKLANIASGAAQIVIGTHALFQAEVAFADLRLAVVDEQHRFGVKQRLELGQKGKAVDMLVMTATPIPRTLAMSQYGDMDLSLLDEKPAGRKPIETVLVSMGRMEQVIDRLRAAIAAGRQAYWVCPLVDESEHMALMAAENRFAALRAQLGEGVVGLVHGQLPPADKDAAVADFVAGRSRVLVATTVIEVGVNVPTASIMVIEHAEHFGLAQLHQLRGRIGRGAEASSCLLLYEAPLGESARARLEIMRETEDGFRIADEDMRLRGAGDVLGTAQSGLPHFRIADLETQGELMATARKDAQLLLERDPQLETPRGQAVRVLLYLMDRDAAIRLMSVG
ncbi:MAG: ATP-dependent DNA helicase RecG, partial [Paracoccaceae bacterium]